MSIDRWLDRKDVVHMHKGILLSHEKAWNWVICRNVSGSRDCDIESSKPEIEEQIYIQMYMWNPE